MCLLSEKTNNTKMSKWICTFNDDWLTELTWLGKGYDSKAAYCKLCQDSFDVSNMGGSAVKSHAKGKNNMDKENLKRVSSNIFFNTNNTELPNLLNSTPPESSNANHPHLRPFVFRFSTKKQCTSSSIAQNANVTEAEILGQSRHF